MCSLLTSHSSQLDVEKLWTWWQKMKESQRPSTRVPNRKNKEKRKIHSVWQPLFKPLRISVWLRFSKPANLYFLFLMCLQCIPEVPFDATLWQIQVAIVLRHGTGIAERAKSKNTLGVLGNEAMILPLWFEIPKHLKSWETVLCNCQVTVTGQIPTIAFPLVYLSKMLVKVGPYLGGELQTCLIFTPTWGWWSNWTHIFQLGGSTTS